MSAGRVSVSLSLKPDQAEALNNLAEQTGLTRSALVGLALKKLLQDPEHYLTVQTSKN